MGSAILWVGFNLFVLLALALDLGVFHRKAHKIKLAEAAFGSALWISLALVFGACLWHWYGEQRGLEYFTGYVIEKALSVYNLFVFLVIFRTFQVPEAVQHRVLAWGILGALIMRGIMIAAGAVLVAKFHWILLAFGIRVFTTKRIPSSGSPASIFELRRNTGANAFSLKKADSALPPPFFLCF